MFSPLLERHIHVDVYLTWGVGGCRGWVGDCLNLGSSDVKKPRLCLYLNASQTLALMHSKRVVQNLLQVRAGNARKVREFSAAITADS